MILNDLQELLPDYKLKKVTNGLYRALSEQRYCMDRVFYD